MSDLVKRLRAVANDWPTDAATYGVVEAADRIEALERAEQMAEVHMQDAEQYARREALEEAARVAVDMADRQKKLQDRSDIENEEYNQLAHGHWVANQIIIRIRALMERIVDDE